MQKKRIVRRPVPSFIPSELHEFHPILQQIYASRGIQHKKELEHSLRNLLPYQQLKDINKATQRLLVALQHQQSIIIVGDFDVDGATSTALAVTALRNFGFTQVDYLVPNRFTLGYGLTPEIVEIAAQQKPALLITVDNGITSLAGTQRATELGIDVLITDHHLPGERLPNATAIVNPNQPGDQFPSKHLAGVGVIFYLMLALRACLREQNWFTQQRIPEPNLAELLDLVALGTVADVVPLDANNRVLVHQGLQRIRAGLMRPGIQALLEITNRNINKLMAADLSYSVAPRLNAAGRLTDMSLGIQCLLAPTIIQARQLALQLEQLNNERRELESVMRQQAHEQLQSLQMSQANLPLGLCLFDESWHQGIVGIIASRIKDHWHRPTIAFAAVDHEELKGSARSVDGIHIRDVLSNIAAKHPYLISKFGGHAMAAGLSLPRVHYEKFCQVFNQELSRLINGDELQGKLYSDGPLRSEDINLDLAYAILHGGPWGAHFPEPLFEGCFYIVHQRLVGNHHLKLSLKAKDTNQIFDGIAFYVDVEQWPNQRVQSIQIVYRLSINEYFSTESPQLVIEYLEPIHMHE